MKNLLMPLVAVCLFTGFTYGQHTLRITIKSSESNETLPFATVQVVGTTTGATAGNDGIAQVNNIPDGEHKFLISFQGFESKTLTLTFPRTGIDVEALLDPHEEELEEIIVTSTRVSRTIENIPTRVETISFEEIDEKSNMRPTNVSMLLHESTGIQVQQTSYSSAMQTIRIQGLDGKYTQLLKDGFPNYSGFASGLSILDIPPLDLRQVEIIKGSASTLYGGGAIAGVVNFVTREPKEKREINIMLNQTSALGSDAAIFLSGKKSKVGFTFLGTGHYQKEYDVDDDDFSELPLQKEVTLFPKLFFYPNNNTTIILGNNFTYSDRIGGDVHVIRGEHVGSHVYYEANNSTRNNTYFSLDKKINDTDKLVIKQSVNIFNRKLTKFDYTFTGSQTLTYTDVSYLTTKSSHTLVFGANFFGDWFNEGAGTSSLNRDTDQQTVSLYAQDNWDITEKFLVEGGIRLDHNFTYKTFVLPRLSLLYKFSENFSTRLGGGLGYKAPTLFTEETETLFFENVLPLGDDLKSEKSFGVNLDLNFTHDFTDRFSVGINQLFFYTQINDPLILHYDGTFHSLANETDPIQTKGFETNVRFIFDPFKFFVGYTYLNAHATYKTGNTFLSLTPRGKVNMALLAEKERNYKIGLEAYYTGHQYLDSGRKTPTYWEFGFFAEKTFGKVSIFINFENFTDTRQNRVEEVVHPPYEDPTFEQVYMHTDGFITNGGVKLRL